MAKPGIPVEIRNLLKKNQTVLHKGGEDEIRYFIRGSFRGT